MHRVVRVLLPCLAIVAAAACDDASDAPAPTPTASTRLFVAHDGVLAAWDLATGEQVPGEVQDVTSPADLQALHDGTLLVNLGDRNEILVVDGTTMLEVKRIPSSGLGAKRPVHSFVVPERNGRKLWMSLNDGAAGEAGTYSAVFVDLDPSSATHLERVGEVALGAGHHKASFSHLKDRVVISSISECDRVLEVFDFSDLSDIRSVAVASAADLGWDGSDREHTCDPTRQNGAPPAPHGCATSKLSGKAYCNLTTSGDLVAVDLDADPPTFSKIATGGTGAGYTKADPTGRWIFSLQGTPREVPHHGPPGPTCQIGQLVVVDAESDTVAAELPLLYDGPGCTRSLADGDEASATPGHMQLHDESGVLLVTPAGGHGDADARVRRELVVDVSDPTAPVQLASLTTPAGSGHVGDAHSGDHRFVFLAHNEDGKVSQIDCDTLEIVRTIEAKARPKTMATWGEAEGPSHQTGPVH